MSVAARSIARLAVAFATVSFALGGCATAGPSASEPSTVPTATTGSTDPVATPPATVAPTTEPSGAMSIVDGDLAAGSYRSTSLGPEVSFDLGPGWQGAADIEDVGFAVSRPEIAGGVTVTHFGGDVFSDPCSSTASQSLEPTAEAFVGWLTAHPELRAAEPIDTTLGGHPAIRVDLTSDVGTECPDGPRIWLWSLPVVGDFHLNEDEAARFIVADIGGRTIVVVIETFDMTAHEQHLAVAEPVLASMVIEP